MRFAHIADLHLGAVVDQGSPWEKKTTAELFSSFVNLIDIFETDNLDFLFITGDLFDHIPTEDELRQVDMQLARLEKTYIIYVTGDADHLSKESPLWKYKFRSNTFLMNGEPFNNCVPESRRPVRNSYAEGIVDSVYFEKYNLDIYGICQYNAVNHRNDLDYVYARDFNRKNILLAHGGDKDVSPFDLDDIDTKRFDYIGMGHSHVFRCKKERNFYYPGSHEPLAPEDAGEHGYIKGYLDKDTNSVKFKNTAQRSYKTINIDADDTFSNSKLNEYLEKVCSKDKACIFFININRSNNCYTEYNIDELKAKYRILNVVGDTALGADFKQLEKINADNILGKNLKRIRESKSPNANAAFVSYAHAMSKLLWENENVDIKSRIAEKSQAVLANKQVTEDKKQEINVLKKHMKNLSDEHSELTKKLGKYQDQTGNLNEIREEKRAIEYEVENVSFKDVQVDEIYSRRRLGFILLIDTPIALALAYFLTVGVIFAFFLEEWQAWYVKTVSCLALFVLFNLLGYLLYNKTKKLRKKLFNTPIPHEEHAKNKTMLQSLERRLEICLVKEAEYVDKQQAYLKITKEKKELEKKMTALEGKYKEAVLISGEL